MKFNVASVMVLLTGFFLNAGAQASTPSDAILGNHSGRTANRSGECTVTAQQRWGYLDISITSDGRTFRLRDISMRSLNKAIAEGYAGQFVVYSPKMPLSSNEWYVTGAFFEDGSLNFISIVHNWSESWPFGGKQEHADCSIGR